MLIRLESGIFCTFTLLFVDLMLFKFTLHVVIDGDEDELNNCDLSGSFADSSRLALSGRDSKLTESGGVGGVDKPREGDTDDDTDDDTDLEGATTTVA